MMPANNTDARGVLLLDACMLPVQGTPVVFVMLEFRGKIVCIYAPVEKR